jgi:hypothetical protein
MVLACSDDIIRTEWNAWRARRYWTIVFDGYSARLVEVTRKYRHGLIDRFW